MPTLSIDAVAHDVDRKLLQAIHALLRRRYVEAYDLAHEVRELVAQEEPIEIEHYYEAQLEAFGLDRHLNLLSLED